MVEEIIRPALAAGKVVVSDRFLLANVVYQGCGGGLDIEQLWQVGTVATGGLLPDLTLIRLESRGVDYFKRVRNGFLSQAARGGLSVKVIAADKPVAEVQQSIRKVFLHG
jgi:dTMP kinase